MLPLAVTAIEAMKEMPINTWLKIGAGILVVVVVFVIVPKVFKMNKIILCIIGFVASTIIFFSWVSQRNEPKFLTPLIDQLVLFFPTETLRVDDKKNPKPKPKPKPNH